MINYKINSSPVFCSPLPTTRRWLAAPNGLALGATGVELRCKGMVWGTCLGQGMLLWQPQTDRESNVLLVLLIGVHHSPPFLSFWDCQKKSHFALRARLGLPSIPVAAKGTLAVAPSAPDRAVGAPPARQGCWSCYALVMARTSAKKAPEDGEGEVVRVVTIWWAMAWVAWKEGPNLEVATRHKVYVRGYVSPNMRLYMLQYLHFRYLKWLLIWSTTP
jgi:hypothetical protein